MYSLYTGQCPKGFQYIDSYKDENKYYSLGDTYVDSYGNVLTIVEFQRFKDYKSLSGPLRTWQQNAKRINTKKDPKFMSRKDQQLQGKSAHSLH